jgi:hypothetical protein
MNVPAHIRLLGAFLALSLTAHAGLLTLASGVPWPRVFANSTEMLATRLVVQENVATELPSPRLDDVAQGGLPVAQPKSSERSDVALAQPATTPARASNGLAIVGASTVTPAWTMIEYVQPFWDAHYGGAPDVDVLPPELIGDADLGYPSDAPVHSGPARVTALILVSADGRPDYIIMTDGTAPFSNYAEVALRGLRFKPAERNGQPVRHYLSLEIDFWPDSRSASAAGKQVKK